MPKSRSRSRSKTRKHSRKRSHSRAGSRSRFRKHSRSSRRSHKHHRNHSRSGAPMSSRMFPNRSNPYSLPLTSRMFPFRSESTYQERVKESAEKLTKQGKEMANWLLSQMKAHPKYFIAVSAGSLLVAVTALGIRAAWPRIKAKYEEIRAKHSTPKPKKAKSKSRSKRRSRSRSGSSASSVIRGKAKDAHKYAKEMADWLIAEIKKNKKLFAYVSVASLAVAATALGIRKAWPRIKAALEQAREKIKGLRQKSSDRESALDGPQID